MYLLHVDWSKREHPTWLVMQIFFRQFEQLHRIWMPERSNIKRKRSLLHFHYGAHGHTLLDVLKWLWSMIFLSFAYHSLPIQEHLLTRNFPIVKGWSCFYCSFSRPAPMTTKGSLLRSHFLWIISIATYSHPPLTPAFLTWSDPRSSSAKSCSEEGLKQLGPQLEREPNPWPFQSDQLNKSGSRRKRLSKTQWFWGLWSLESSWTQLNLTFFWLKMISLTQ